jgi:DNA-damage-inducible protein J
MAKGTSMYIQIDPQVKADVEAIYSRYGMSIADAINIFLHQSRNIGGLPFDLRASGQTENARTADSMKGFLKSYADSALIPEEKGAWERAVAEKHGNLLSGRYLQCAEL